MVVAALGLISRCVAIRSAQHRSDRFLVTSAAGVVLFGLMLFRLGSAAGTGVTLVGTKGAPPAPSTLRCVPPLQSNGWGQGQIQGIVLKGASAGSARGRHGLSDVLLSQETWPS